MDQILAMTVFRRVAERQSFSAAARDLRLSNAAVSKHVAALEEHLEVRLLQRTTRRVTLTPAGEIYLQRATRILEDLSELEQDMTQAKTVAQGTLRVNAPMAFGLLHVSPLTPKLLARWPELSLELTLNDRFVDLVEERVDVALRITTALPDSSSVVAQKLTQVRQIVCAAPKYLRKHGQPRAPADLLEHNCLAYDPVPEWIFERPQGDERIAVSGNLRVNSSLAIRDAVLAGVGVGRLPAFYVHDLLAEGSLREVLSEYPGPLVHIYAVFPKQRHVSAKTRLFVEFMREHFSRAAWALAPGRGPSPE